MVLVHPPNPREWVVCLPIMIAVLRVPPGAAEGIWLLDALFFSESDRHRAPGCRQAIDPASYLLLFCILLTCEIPVVNRQKSKNTHPETGLPKLRRFPSTTMMFPTLRHAGRIWRLEAEFLSFPCGYLVHVRAPV